MLSVVRGAQGTLLCDLGVTEMILLCLNQAADILRAGEINVNPGWYFFYF